MRMYIYLDHNIINSLYNSEFGNIVEISNMIEKGYNAHMSLLGRIKSKFFVSVHGEVSGQLEKDQRSVTEEKRNVSTEEKILKLVDNINDIQPLQDIVRKNLPLKSPMIFAGRAFFCRDCMYYDMSNPNMRKYVKKRDPYGEMPTKKDWTYRLYFETGTERMRETYRDTFGMEYQKSIYPEYEILMECSSEKWTINMTYSFPWGECTQLNVFGSIKQINKNFFHIKPFAIWT